MADFELIVIPAIATVAFWALALFGALTLRRALRAGVAVQAGGGAPAAAADPMRLSTVQSVVFVVSAGLLGSVALFVALFFLITG